MNAKTKFQELEDAYLQSVQNARNYQTEVNNFVMAFRSALVDFLGCDNEAVLWHPTSRESLKEPLAIYTLAGALTFDYAEKKWRFGLQMILHDKPWVFHFWLVTERNLYRIGMEPTGPEGKIGSAGDRTGLTQLCQAVHQTIGDWFRKNVDRLLEADTESKKIGFIDN